MANYVVSDTSLGSVADAIRTKGGTSSPLTYPQGFIDAIDDIQTGGSAVIQSLTVTENGTYTAPSGVDGYSPVTVNVSGGDEPIPDDGKTRIFIHIAEDTPDNRLTFYLRFTASVADNTTVDWGDGTTETLGSTSATNYGHTYAQGGDYVITLTVNTGTISFAGNSSNSIYGATSNYYNQSRIRKVIIGNDVTAVGNYAFNSCVALFSVKILGDVSRIGDYAFTTCYALMIITVSDSVTNIGNSAFSACRSMFEYHFKPTTPPTLGGSSAFSNIPSDCKIYVPYSADHSILDAYKTATNWSAHASKIQEEPT